MPIQTSDQLTPRESLLMEYEKEENRLSREFALAMKDREIELSKLEARLSSWLRVPIAIVKLPVVALWILPFGVALIVSIFKKSPLDVGELWKQLK